MFALLSAASPDFHLQLGSPLIDSGAPLDSVTTDYDGMTRPYGRGYDVGAFERH
ncbi:MAG: choice-of-anchor Q domain-containing protein [Candidatus Binatus sp.]|uniref:choice-of-anchor Q domain-containing protein n=1 Tax=Candidatus Binatus sp. TaxID=2811406 RepID=UPI002726E0FA|nr:choice-of-anchor Q domain-containing protein [Candidatus Binatus sp.]MDO8432679.1 choice-of-anchor Q domain-containing protein [Candidatus Binatus sp.]